MEVRTLLEVLHTAERLKDTTRHCYTSGGRQESVAEHSWRLALMAYLVKGEFPDADMNKVILMCLIHDLGESFTGDIPTFLKTASDEEQEEALLKSWVSTLPAPFDREMGELYLEMSEQRTAEARIYKALDKLEAVIQHNESDIASWLDNEYSLNLRYGDDNVKFSEYLTRLREEIRTETQNKIAAAN